MEHIHGIDVSWMTHGSSKDKPPKARQRSQTLPARPRDSPTLSPVSSPIPGSPTRDGDSPGGSPPSSPRAIPNDRPGIGRINSAERMSSSFGSPSRRGSWFSNISSKFSSSAQSPPPQGVTATPKPAELSVPKANPAKNAVLQHAAKSDGDGPYTPAPPRTTPSSILHVFRRLSSSNGSLSPVVKGQHGLVERMVLNVDRHRERCPLSELNQAKLRRVSFCVDVEIAPMPKYAEGDAPAVKATGDKTQKKKLAEKSEGEALKNPKLVEEQKEQEGVIKATGEEVPKEPSKEGTPGTGDDTKSTKPAAPDTTAEKAADGSKKKEKKKKSEEERKARKEKKRKLAEANGSIPMEIHADSDSSSEEPVAGHAPRVQYIPTTNPVRIYRRCCQLRETPILKKITEQLSDGNNFLKDSSMVDKLDLTGYWLQLPDLITLGDYLAVVPIREVILENCGLTDEGLRVILAGLLAAKKPERRSRKPVTEPDGLTKQGGVVERLVLKNNKIGPEGWKHICLFIYMCRTIKSLDISSLHFPHATTTTNGHYGLHLHEAAKPLTTCQLLAKSIGERLAGPHLELINIGDTGLNSDELGAIIDGMIKCGINRLGLAHNDIDAKGVEHVSRYIASGKCEGLDLGGNPMQDHIEALAHSLSGDSPLRAISLAECNLTPSSLCKLLPPLVKLKNFLFIDLSHNHELFNAQPSAVAVLRRFLPKMRFLKRIHLADVSMNASQAIALAEILPEIPDLAHINFLQNPELTKLADARTEEHQEEACALFASLLAATRVSHSIIAVDIDVPTEQSGEIVRAMAKQVVAYCLRNMERLPLPNAASMIGNDAINIPTPGAHPDVIQHLVGHDSHMIDDEDGDEAAPDDDYVIGGTGVVKALACCLDNRGDESRRPSGEFGREPGSGASTPRTRIGPSKAKDMSKHLLGSARRIRHRLQPALARAKASAGEDTNTYHRLLFLDQTLDRMIKRFEDEFPETRETEPSAETASLPGSQTEQKEPSINSAEGEMAPVVSDGEDETEIRPPMSRSNSVISMSSKGLTNEEGRILRAGHRFRSGWFNERHINLLAGVEEVGTDPMHVRILHELLDDIGNEELKKLVEKDGPIKVFKEHRDLLLNTLREQDPEHWASFMHSQWMARANIKPEAGANQHDEGAKAPSAVVDEVAVSD